MYDGNVYAPSHKRVCIQTLFGKVARLAATHAIIHVIVPEIVHPINAIDSFRREKITVKARSGHHSTAHVFGHRGIPHILFLVCLLHDSIKPVLDILFTIGGHMFTIVVVPPIMRFSIAFVVCNRVFQLPLGS
jgi:hypothetical protein